MFAVGGANRHAKKSICCRTAFQLSDGRHAKPYDLGNVDPEPFTLDMPNAPIQQSGVPTQPNRFSARTPADPHLVHAPWLVPRGRAGPARQGAAAGRGRVHGAAGWMLRGLSAVEAAGLGVHSRAYNPAGKGRQPCGSRRSGRTGVCTARADNPAGEDQGPGGSGRRGGTGVRTARVDNPAGEDQGPGGSGRSGGAVVGTARAYNPAGEDQGPGGSGGSGGAVVGKARAYNPAGEGRQPCSSGRDGGTGP